MRQMTENFVSRIRWATDKYKHSKENYGFKSTDNAPVSPLLKPFEDDLYDLIANLEYNEYRSAFQNKNGRSTSPHTYDVTALCGAPKALLIKKK